MCNHFVAWSEKGEVSSCWSRLRFLASNQASCFLAVVQYVQSRGKENGIELHYKYVHKAFISFVFYLEASFTIYCKVDSEDIWGKTAILLQ